MTTDSATVFYVTTAANHPKGSGYWRAFAADRDAARDKTFEILGAKWAFMYDALDQVHEWDRTHHGDIR